MKKAGLFIFISVMLSGCLISGKTGMPDVRYSESIKPPAPDYSQLSSWASHPDLQDPADLTPSDTLKPATNAAIDVFFIYPTIFVKKPKDVYQWNANIQNEKLNKRIDETTIKLQASAFNGAGNIYAPRYRQAHVAAFYTPFKEDRDSSLTLAYQDVKSSFLYYLEHWNNGRPFIIASHSQGTVHAERLVKELIDGKELQKQLVAAYLVGMPLSADSFQSVPPCTDENQTGCIISWCSYAYGYIPTREAYTDSEKRKNLIATNPLSWQTDTTYVTAAMNIGGTLFKLDKTYPGMCDAQNHEGLLWIRNLDFPGSFFVRKMQNYHVADYNLFYMNVRENARKRAATFLLKK